METKIYNKWYDALNDLTDGFNDRYFKGQFDNYFVKPIWKDIYEKYYSVFWNFYFWMNERFKTFFGHEDLWWFLYYTKSLPNFVSLIKEIELNIKHEINAKDKRIDIKKIEIYLIEDSDELTKKRESIKKEKGKSKLHLGILKSKIIKYLEHNLFIEALYFISIAEKKYIRDKNPSIEEEMTKAVSILKEIPDLSSAQVLSRVLGETVKSDPNWHPYNVLQKHKKRIEKEGAMYKIIKELQ